MASSAGGMVTYICNAGYEPVGGTTRECLCSGVWSGNEPTCQGIYTQCAVGIIIVMSICVHVWCVGTSDVFLM